jgi:hypothetical protein
MTAGAMFRTVLRSVLAAALLGPVIGTALVAPFLVDRKLSMVPAAASAGVLLFGPVCALAGLVAGGVAIILARYTVNTERRATWLARGITVGVAIGAAAILVTATLLRAWQSGIVWAYAGLGAVSGGCVGLLVAMLTWADVSAWRGAPPQQPTDA